MTKSISISEEGNPSKMGTDIATGLGWDGALILETLIYALEDANFHKEANEIYTKYKKQYELECKI